MFWIVAAAGLVLAIGAACWWWRRRKQQKQTRLISFVALLRKPASIDPTVLARLAGKVWRADLGDGNSEGADGFVVGAGMLNAICYQGRWVLVHSLPRPYVDNPEQAAADIADLRIRSLFAQHQAWFSCDATDVDPRAPDNEVRDWCRRLGKLFAELLDDNCLLIFLPDSNMVYPINEETEQALRSEDPIRSLQETLTVPLIEVPADDPFMQQAVARARADWPRFVAAFEAQAGTFFSVKAPVSHSGNTEFIWISVTRLEGERIYGELNNEPANLGPLRLGSKVSVPVAELNDWCFMDPQGKLVGGFTIAAVHQAARRPRPPKGQNE
ncbi:MAG TPA: DUF2314 domain-containing protein [Planctomycetota bacterium]|nr:DUF2314 domain-containing protein [Planctomycetota bacterium]